MRIVSYIIALIIIILGLTFAAMNANTVSFNYYLGIHEISLSLLLVYALGIGVILGLCVALSVIFRLKRENMHLKHRLKNVEKEVENLRTIPVKDGHSAISAEKNGDNFF